MNKKAQHLKVEQEQNESSSAHIKQFMDKTLHCTFMTSRAYGAPCRLALGNYGDLDLCSLRGFAWRWTRRLPPLAIGPQFIPVQSFHLVTSHWHCIKPTNTHALKRDSWGDMLYHFIVHKCYPGSLECTCISSFLYCLWTALKCLQQCFTSKINALVTGMWIALGQWKKGKRWKDTEDKRKKGQTLTKNTRRGARRKIFPHKHVLFHKSSKLSWNEWKSRKGQKEETEDERRALSHIPSCPTDVVTSLSPKNVNCNEFDITRLHKQAGGCEGHVHTCTGNTCKWTHSQPTLGLFVSEDCARALHVRLEQLRGRDQTGLLSRRQTGRLGFGTWGGTAADTRQVLQTQWRL